MAVAVLGWGAAGAPAPVPPGTQGRVAVSAPLRGRWWAAVSRQGLAVGLGWQQAKGWRRILGWSPTRRQGRVRLRADQGLVYCLMRQWAPFPTRRCRSSMSRCLRRPPRGGPELGLGPRRQTPTIAGPGGASDYSPSRCYRRPMESETATALGRAAGITTRGFGRGQSAGRRWECRDRRDTGS